MTTFLKKRADRIISRKAADFVVKAFSGRASAVDESELMYWLEENPKHRDAYRDVLGIWEASGQIAGMSAEIAQVTKAPWIRIGVAMGLALVLGVSMLLVLPDKNQFSAYVTIVGEQKTITLPDGSIATLNTNTRLVVDQSNGSILRLYLENGEAFFEVSEGQARTFTVEAGARSVTALGTKFSVQRSGNAITVAVLEGAVAVHEHQQLEQARRIIKNGEDAFAMGEEDDQELFRIAAGGIATFTATTHVVSRKDVPDLEKQLAWHDGYLRFEDEALMSVIEEMNRYQDRPIYIVGDTVGSLRISGVFQLSDADGMWQGLETILPINIHEFPDRIEISDH